MILRALPGPFLASLLTLIILILLQFLMRYLPELVGKGLSFSIIVEIISYNLAYMIVLSVPMSVLIATIYVFARLVQSGGYMVMKGSGVSLFQIIWPVLIVGGLLGAGMTYFNNYMLPEANYRAKNLWQDIRQKKPSFGLEEGVFNSDIKATAFAPLESMRKEVIFRTSPLLMKAMAKVKRRPCLPSRERCTRKKNAAKLG